MLEHLTLHFRIWVFVVHFWAVCHFWFYWHDWHLKVLHEFVKLSNSWEALLTNSLVLAGLWNFSDSISQLAKLPLIHVVFQDYIPLGRGLVPVVTIDVFWWLHLMLNLTHGCSTPKLPQGVVVTHQWSNFIIQNGLVRYRRYFADYTFHGVRLNSS